MLDRRGFIGLMGMACLSLMGCGTGNEVTTTTESPDSTAVSTQSERPAQPRVTESCFFEQSGFGYWVAIVENPNTAYAATYMDVTATAYDEEGNILGTSEGYTQLLLPQHKVAFCEQFGDYVPASIEVEVDPMDDGEFAVWDLETDGNPTFEVANLNEVTDEYSTTINGTVHNDYTQKTYIEVVVVMRDADGNLVAGANGYVDDATAKDDTVFSAQMYDIAPEHASLEGYANADVPN